jgi:hypothetical protein
VSTVTGTSAHTVSKELSLVPECERIIDEAVKGLGGLDIVVSNAVSATINKPETVTKLLA